MVPQPRSGSFSPHLGQTLQTGNHNSPHSSHAGVLSAGASPSNNSPTGTNSLTKIVVLQVYLLLSTIKEDPLDSTKFDTQEEQLRKLIDENGMEVFSKYFSRLVAGNASQIFPGLNRPATANNNHHILVNEMRKLSHDVDQASRIVEAVDVATEDIFRDFDLSTFMEHFKLDALEKTLLALAFKTGSRPDLKTKADAILSANFATFINIISRPDIGAHADLSSTFIASIISRLLQYHPPSFNVTARDELHASIHTRYHTLDIPPPSEVLAALDLGRVLDDRPANFLTRYIQRTGPDFTRDEETCLSCLQNRPNNVLIGPEQTASALTFTAINQNSMYNPGVLVLALERAVPKTFDWNEVVSFMDQPSARITSPQFLRLYNALLPIAREPKHNFDIQRLWGGSWRNSEAQLSFICAYASLSPDQLDATTIPGLQRSIKIEDYAKSLPNVQERAVVATRHPLVSVAALTAIFSVALNSMTASQTIEAKRLFQEVVVPNLDIFLVSSFEVPKQSWEDMAADTLSSLLETFISKKSTQYDFVLDSLWRKDKDWIVTQLIEAHAVKPSILPLVFEHAVRHNWLDILVYLPNGFGIDLAAFAHAEGYLDLNSWANLVKERSGEISITLMKFLMIKSELELRSQRPLEGHQQGQQSTSLQVRTVSALLAILEDFLPKAPMQDLIIVQRLCITAYPRLINYGEGFDDIIDANGKDGNVLPLSANAKMEDHYKKMYGDEIQVRTIVDILDQYKRSRDPLDQDTFACMIHGLFDEYNHYGGYPLEALATTAVLFGGIISHKLISDLPLKIGLGMILEAVRDHMPDDPMYKFGLQALMQLLVRFREWPGFCKQLLQIPGLRNTDAFKKAEEIIRDHEFDAVRSNNGAGTPHGIGFGADSFPNGTTEGQPGGDSQAPAFSAINMDPVAPSIEIQEPAEEDQGKIQFVLNNITEGTLQTMRNELHTMLESKHQQWFASHLVEERAKMQPNYHHVYLELVTLLSDKKLWNEVLRETYGSVARLLNSEATLQNSTERTHLKNLGGWLGLLTLARDRPIKHKNIAFKQLLIEAHDTKRLIVVIPFVCKVLIQGASSAVFRPPNPWLMDIIHLLIELYHHAELKLNLKFEIEVLCKGLNLDHKSIEPSGEILNRPTHDEHIELLVPDQVDAFESMALNGLGSTVGSSMSAQNVAAVVPDLGPLITIPPTNEMVVTTSRLHEIVRSALTRALQDIIQPVVDRSVTIAAISTAQMIRKDFVAEPDENRIRTSAVNMVKTTAGSLALVTSKEPLRANLTNYMRSFSNDLPAGLPEGTIIMCVNSNLDLACSIIERQAEERAVPEIEDMIEPELEARRRHRLEQPNEAFYAGAINRWAMTIPNPYKLSPKVGGLNSEQMAIYEDFARQPRTVPAASAPSHAASTSDATRSLANEVLQEPFTTMSSIPTPAETPSLPQLGTHMQLYAPQSGGSANVASGRNAGYQIDFRGLAERVSKLLQELLRVAGEAREDHFLDLPRPHPVLDVVDAMVQLIIKTSQNSEEFAIYAAEQISGLIFQQHFDDNLALESLVHVLETLRKISGHGLNIRVRALFSQQPASNFLSLPLLAALCRTDLLDWSLIDLAMSKALEARKEGSLEFFEHLLDFSIVSNRPIALYADFVKSLEAAWLWVSDDPSSVVGQRLRAKLIESDASQTAKLSADANSPAVPVRQEHVEYVLEEWVRLCNNTNASHKAAVLFVEQLQMREVIRNRDEFVLFIRVAIESAVDRFEHIIHSGILNDAYAVIDSLARLVAIYMTTQEDDSFSPVSFLDSILVLITLIIHHHQLKRGEAMNQRLFFRLLSMLMHEIYLNSSDISDKDFHDMMVKFAVRFYGMGPRYLPGFVFGWLSLIQHRIFLPTLIQMPDNVGWNLYARLLVQLLECLSEQLKAFVVLNISRELYKGTLKLLVVLQHDFPEFVAGNQLRLCSSISPHCTQLLNAILLANPQQGLAKSSDARDDVKIYPGMLDEAKIILRECGLLNLVERTTQNGPSEDTVAQIAHAMTQGEPRETAYGHVTVAANPRIISAIVIYVSNHAAERLSLPSTPMTVNGNEPEVSTLSLLIHELAPEARYYLIVSITNQLRFPCGMTEFCSQLLLHVFGKDINDPEETDIREEITRVIFERLVGFWPQPWGLMLTVLELAKNEKYMFFDLPFIKSTPEVGERFAAILQRA